MANVDNAIGFVPTPLVRARRYHKDADEVGNAHDVCYAGDIVQLQTDGEILSSAVDGAKHLGAAVTFLTSGVQGVVQVADHPDQEFICQDDGSGTVSWERIGENADHVRGAGTLALKKSGHELDLSSATAGAAGFAILDFVSSPDNAISDYARTRVICREHFLKGATNNI